MFDASVLVNLGLNSNCTSYCYFFEVIQPSTADGVR